MYKMEHSARCPLLATILVRDTSGNMIYEWHCGLCAAFLCCRWVAVPLSCRSGNCPFVAAPLFFFSSGRPVVAICSVAFCLGESSAEGDKRTSQPPKVGFYLGLATAD
jgi:hypothetical protein